MTEVSETARAEAERLLWVTTRDEQLEVAGVLTGLRGAKALAAYAKIRDAIARYIEAAERRGASIERERSR